MFGALKDKLKNAIKKFSRSAQEDLAEEKVEDAAAIEEAKSEEQKRLAKKAPAKPKRAPPEKGKPEKKAKPAAEKELGAKKAGEDLPAKAAVPEKKAVELPERVESKGSPKEMAKSEEKRSKEPTAPPPKAPGKKSFSLFRKKEAEQPVRKEASSAEPAIPTEEAGFLGKLKDAFTKKQLSEEKFDELFWELEIAMLENNVAVEVIEKIKRDLRDELTSGKVTRMGVEDMILTRLRQSIDDLFSVEPFDLVERAQNAQKPYKICVIGVNGSGKTTTLAKIAKKFLDSGLSVVVAASDTFRAAAIDQLRQHTDRLGVKLISQGYEADPAAVAFDAIEHAKAKKIDVVLIDTAGRLHSNKNLMAELEKVVRVAKPDLKLFVGEAITGNDCVEQAKVFDSLVGIDAIILSKADIDEKGGAAVSVSYITGKPILYLGTGQRYEDLEPFEKEKILEAVGL